MIRATLAIGALLAPGSIASADVYVDDDDNLGPVVGNYRVLGEQFDVTRTGGQISVLVRITDPDGFSHGSVTFERSGAPALKINSLLRTGGTTTDGEYLGTMIVKVKTAPGDYVPTFTVFDTANNKSTVTGSTPLTITRTDDTQGPSVGTVSVEPSAIDVTAGPQTVTYSVRATDPGSGVSGGGLELMFATGNSLWLDRVTGRSDDGVYSATRTYGPGTAAGTIAPTSLVAKDVQGNTTNDTAPGGALTVSRTLDTVGPQLVSVGSASVDTTAGAATATIPLHITDPISGLSSAAAYFRSPDGTQSTGNGFTVQSLSAKSGDAFDGTWELQVAIPSRSGTGDWTLTSVQLTDVQGNLTNYDEDNPPPAATIHSTTSPDTEAPTFTSITIDPPVIVAEGPPSSQRTARVVAGLAFGDPVSGLADVKLTFAIDDYDGPDTTIEAKVPQQSAFESGDTRSGRVRVNGLLPAVATNWHLETVELTDLAGNSASFPASGAVKVLDGYHDSTPPSLESLDLPATVDVTGGAIDVPIGLTVTDTPAEGGGGFADGFVELESPTGRDRVAQYFNGQQLTSGIPTDGTFTNTVSVGPYVESGTWHVILVRLHDRAGNYRTLTGADLADVPTMTVNSNDDTTSPSFADLTADATSLDTTYTSTPITFRLHAGDAGSGLDVATLTLTGPGGRTVDAIANDLAYGGPRDEYRLDWYPPSYNTTGDWHATKLELVDVRGNSRVVTGPELNLPTITVVSATDTVKPTVAEVYTLRPVIDVSHASREVDVLVDIADTTLIQDLAIKLSGPNGATLTPSTIVPVSDSWWLVRVTFPKGAATGSWTVGPVVARDDAGNVRTVASAGTVTVGTADPPAAPQDLSATSQNGAVTLDWGGVSAAATPKPTLGYTASAGPDFGCVTTATSCTITGLKNGTAYTFVVRATGSGGTGDASAPAKVTPRIPTSVTITAATKQITYGDAITVTGKLTRTDTHTALSGRTVRLEYRNVGSTGGYQTADTDSSDAAGKVTFTGFKPKQNIELRLAVSASGAYAADTSPTQHVACSRDITITAPAKVTKGEKFTISGSIHPAKAGTTIVLQRKSGRKWFKVDDATAKGTYKFHVTAKTKAKVTYRTKIAADDLFAVAFSLPKSVEVHSPGNSAVGAGPDG